MPHAVAEIDLAAIAHNLRLLRARTRAEVMAVVKADGYGHGMVPAARAALTGGATWLGVATLSEALALREAGLTVPVLAWLWTVDEVSLLARAVTAGIDIGVSTQAQLHALTAAAGARTVRVHLKVDTGLARNGAPLSLWQPLLDHAAAAAAAGAVEVVGVWSHLARADEPDEPTTACQRSAFEQALEQVRRAGLRPAVRHLANSAAALTAPDTHYDLVRVGIAAYGLNPVPTLSVDLQPAMTVRARIANVKRVAAGQGVSYGHTYITPAATTLALVPLGYGDGVPRAASNRAPVAIGGGRATISGRVCMDQFVVDVGNLGVAEGDGMVLFGNGGPSAQEWADAVGTIHYEIVTRIGTRVPRTYLSTERTPLEGHPAEGHPAEGQPAEGHPAEEDMEGSGR